MALKDIAGQTHIKRQLIGAIRNRKVGHAYIFAGPKGVGKRKAAKEFAKALNCLNFSDDVCDKCGNCQKIEHDNHPDFLWIRPEGKSIKIDQIRQLQKDINYIPYGVNNKVFIIEQADLLTNQAANSLLKFLEDPGKRTIAILIVENHNQLISTIRSRCQIINFSHLDPYNLIRELDFNEKEGNDILIAAHIISDIEVIKRVVQTGEFAKLKSLMLQLIDNLFNNNYSALNTISQFSNNDDFKENSHYFLALLLLYFKDLINIKIGRNQSIVFLEYRDILEKQALKLTENQILNYIEEVIDIKKKLSSNVNLQLSLEHLVLSLWEGK